MINSNITVKRVCSIRFVLIVRFMFGYYFELHKPLVMRTLSKFYCIVIGCLVNYICYINSVGMNRIVVASSIIESMFFIVSSLCNKEEYILDFFRFRPITDGLPFAKNTFKILERLLKLFCLSIFAFKMITCFFFCIPLKDVCFNSNPLPVLSHIIQSLSLEVASLSFVLIFSLLYCRVNIIKSTVLKKGFTSSPRKRFRPRRYMQMYETVLKTLNDTDNPLRLLVSCFMVTYIPAMLYGICSCITDFKENGPTYTNVAGLLNAIQPSGALFIAAILQDKAMEDLVDVKWFTIAKCSESSNDRERLELEKLWLLLEEYPLRYHVFRIFPLSVKPLIGFLSFSIISILSYRYR